MSLRSADLRFVVPHEVSTVMVLNPRGTSDLTRVMDGFSETGAEVRDGSNLSGPVDLVVAEERDRRQALALRGRTHLLLGTSTVPMRARAGKVHVPLLIRGGVGGPRTVLPIDTPSPLTHHLRNIAPLRGQRGLLRDAALLGAARAPVPLLRLAARASLAELVGPAGADLRPGLLQAAEHLGIEAGNAWVLALGTGDDLQRAVFHVPRRDRPGWVVKFTRVAGYDASFVRDEAGLALARAAGPRTRAHTPQLLGRLQFAGLAASVETAGVGRQLLHLLPAQPRQVLEDVVDWVLGVGMESRGPDELLGDERARLQQLLAAAAMTTGAPVDLVDRVPAVPAVLQHNDLGSWNILSDGHGFTVVDWESARSAGMPLWDLLYFAADVLARLDGPAEPRVLVDRVLRICSGQSPRSAVLFRWVHAAARVLQVPLEAVGPLAALCWLHHGQSAALRSTQLAGASAAPLGHLALLAPAWLAHPGLGTTWPTLTAG